MTQAWPTLRIQSLDAVRLLAGVLADNEAADSTLIAAYIDARSALILAYAKLAQERYANSMALDDAVKSVEAALNVFTDIPDRYRKMRNYSATHRILLAYLVRNVGKPVPFAILKMINQEQSETARRTRELRTLGFDIEAVRTGGQNSYTLKASRPDIHLAVRHQIAHQIREDKSLTQQQQIQLLQKYSCDLPTS
jgi:hypothetical protein